MAISVTQSNAAASAAPVQTPTFSVSFASSVSQLHTVVVGILTHFQVVSVSDSKGNTYVRDLRAQSGFGEVSFWHAIVETGGTSFTVTASTGTGVNGWAMGIVEVGTAVLPIASTNAGGLSLSRQHVGPGFLTVPGGMTTFQMQLLFVSQLLADTQVDRLPAAGPFDALYGSILFFPVTTVSGDGLMSVRTGGGNFDYREVWLMPDNAGKPWITGALAYAEIALANFTGTPLSGASPLAVTFTDLSAGGPTSWAWTFGDGGTSTSQNPVHNYTVAGTYSVTLAVANSVGSSTGTRTGYITVDAGGPVFQFTPPGIANNYPPQIGPPIPGAPWMELFQQHDFIPVVPPPDPQTQLEAELEALAVARELALDLGGPASADDEVGLRQAIDYCAGILNDLALSGILQMTADGEFKILTSGFDSDRDPTIYDDETIGAQPGLFWVRRPKAFSLDNLTEEQVPSIWLAITTNQGEAFWVEVETYRADRSTGFTGTK